MAARDRVTEILEKKRRGRKAPIGLHNEFDHLEKQWQTKAGMQADTEDFYPIRAVTLLEVFSRAWGAELIDHGPPYAERALSDKSLDFKPDRALIGAIQGRVITMGEMISHGASLNSFGQVCAFFKILLANDLLPMIAHATSRSMTLADLALPKPVPQPTTIIKDVDAMCRALDRLFEVRHILCHEVLRKKVYETAEVFEFLNGATSFARAANEVFTQLVFGNQPSTIAEMRVDAERGLQKSQKELTEVTAKVTRGADAARRKLFAESEELWVKYRDAQSEVAADEARGGLFSEFLRITEADNLTKERIDALHRSLPDED